jgi:hypothetical protein
VAGSLSYDAGEHWRSLRPRVSPWAAAGAWVLAAAIASNVETRAPCTPAAPCGPSWSSLLGFAWLVLTIGALLVDPPRGAWAGVLLAPFGLFYDATGSGLAAVVTAFAVAALLGVVAAREDVRSWRQRLAFLDDVAVSRVTLPPEAYDPLRRGARGYRIAALVALVVAALAAFGVGRTASRQHARERRAPVVTATVEEVRDTEVTVAVDDQSHTAEAYGDYRVGEEVPVWVIGHGVRLVAEPYDESTTAILPACALVAAVLLARRASMIARAIPIAGDVPAFELSRRVSRFGPAYGSEHRPMVILPVKTRDHAEVAGQLVPRGVVAVRTRDGWVCAGDLARKVPLRPRFYY